MGYNTSCLILNDALSYIENDAELGKKIATAVRSLGGAPRDRVDISAGGHVNAMTVFETHHADQVVPVLIGGNDGRALDVWISWRETDDPELVLLQKLAEKRGFVLHKKPEKKRR